MGRLTDREFVVISSGDDEVELAEMLYYYREHQKQGEKHDLLDLRIEPDAPIRSVYRYHLVRWQA